MRAGGRIGGQRNTPTFLNASGMWNLGDQYNFQRLTIWPPKGSIVQITSSGTYTPSFTGIYEINCVGGGGGGGGWYGSGGAGGFYATANHNLTSGVAYTVTVGNGGAAWNNRSTGTAGAGGTTTFTVDIATSVSAAGGGGGSARNFGTSGVGGNGGSGGAPAANASTGHGGGGGGYDGSHSSKSTCSNQGGQNVGTGQLGVAIGLGTNTRIPGGGAGGFVGGTCAGTRSGLGGPYQGIYTYGSGRGGNYSGGTTATGRGCGGGGANWFANGAGPGLAGMIVVRGPL